MSQGAIYYYRDLVTGDSHVVCKIFKSFVCVPGSPLQKLPYTQQDAERLEEYSGYQLRMNVATVDRNDSQSSMHLSTA